VKRLRLTQDAVELGSTDRADALCHTATRVRDLDFAFEGTLLFALNAVSARVVFKLSYIFFGHGDPPIAAATRRDAQVLPALSVRTRSGYPCRSTRGGISRAFPRRYLLWISPRVGPQYPPQSPQGRPRRAQARDNGPRAPQSRLHAPES